MVFVLAVTVTATPSLCMKARPQRVLTWHVGPKYCARTD